MALKAFVAEKIFTGDDWLTGKTVLVKDGIIDSIISEEDVPSIAAKQRCNGFVAPAFIDLQIYGAFGSLLAVKPTIETLEKTYKYCTGGGANYFLPTVATNPYNIFYTCIDAIRAYWMAGKPGVLGLHIEGPWISKAKRGAHIEDLIHSPLISQVQQLLDYGKGVIKMITVAPEVCSDEVLELIRSYGVVIAAGHSNATFKQATEAFDKGIGTATHLYNAMSPLQHRELGIVGAVMHHNKTMGSIIPDGYHVDFAAIHIAKKVMNKRLFIITDAVTEATEGLYPHVLEDDKYVSNGILSGSALTMGKAVKNCVEKAGIELAEALRMASLYPATVIGMEKQLGKIEKGYQAEFVIMDKDLQVVT
jgi:N-acetylglucosamine-6-phosphate deacetylase